MKTVLKIVLGIAATTVLVVGGLGAGWLLWGQWLWAPGMIGGLGMTYGDIGWEQPEGRAMMGGYSSPTSQAIDIVQARDAVETYIQAPEYSDLEVSEVMQFEQGFYAIVRERDTGIGAMELLVDKTTGAVGPEMGANIMWNTRYYGMHKGGR